MTILNFMLSFYRTGGSSMFGWWLYSSSFTSWISLSLLRTLFRSQAERTSGTALRGYHPLLLFSFYPITFTTMPWSGLFSYPITLKSGLISSVSSTASSSIAFMRWLSFSF